MRILSLTVALVAAMLVLGPSAGAEEGGCAVTSWVAGSVDLCDGVLRYHDYVYDDYGADTGESPSKSWGSLSPQAGDQRYADDAENSADLVRLELWVSMDRLHARFLLNALYEQEQTIAALAIDTDDDPSTGGGAWDGLSVSSSGWDVLETFTTGDPADNVIEGSLPLPAGDRWRIQAVTARADGTVMNVAFRGTAEQGGWWEDEQAAALEDGDIGDFGHTVEVPDLLGGATRAAPDPGPGVFQRVYRSAYAIASGEGYTYDGIPGRAGDAPLFPQVYEFLGHYQPYGIYVPSGAAPHGVQLVLHGASANHASLLRADGLQQRFGEELNRILVVPLGRGRVGFYSDYSERDVLDVMDDVERNYPVDLDRVFAGGYSMGGYGALRFAELYPHRFAGYANWVGFTGDAGNGIPGGIYSYPAGAIGNVTEMVGNLRHVPGANLYAGLDELVHVWTSSLGLQPALEAAGVPYGFYQHPAAEHFTFAVLDDWRKEANYLRDRVRADDPARVTFRTARLTWAPELGIRHDRAYWVRDIVPAGEGYADVDLTTHACGRSIPVITQQDGVGIDPVPWVGRFGVAVSSTPIEVERGVSGSLSRVSSVTVDVEGACLAGGPVNYAITTDGPVTVVLSDGRSVHLENAGRHFGVID